MKKLLPIVIALLGLVGGLGAGFVFKPAPEAKAAGEEAEKDAEAKEKDYVAGMEAGKAGTERKANKDHAYLPLSKPILIPVPTKSGGQAFARVEVSLEVKPDFMPDAEKHEPKVRDALIRALLVFGREGGFTDSVNQRNYDKLRKDLLHAAQGVLGKDVYSVLISEMLPVGA